MTSNNNLDARPDQLKILKLEHRHMRPTAITLLQQSASKKRKLAAVGALSAVFLSVQNAPTSYAEKLHLPMQLAIESNKDLTVANEQCAQICALLTSDGEASEIRKSLEQMFRSIDNIHHRLEAAALQKGARLLGSAISTTKEDADGIGSGGGNDDDDKDNVTWLSRLKI